MSTEPEHPTTDTELERRRKSRIFAAALLGVLLILFAALNSQTVKINWIVTTTHSPLILVIVICGVIGFGVGWLIARRRAKRGEERESR